MLLASIFYASAVIAPAARPCPIAIYGTPTGSWQTPNVRVDLPPFDPALGTLTEVEVFFNFTPTWLYRAENTTTIQGTQSINWFRQFELNVVYRPGFFGPVEWNVDNTVGDGGGSYAAQGLWQAPLPPFDGLLDFQGVSGLDTSYGHSGQYTALVVLHETNPRALAYWQIQAPKTFYISPRFLQGTESGFPSHSWASEEDIRLNFGGSVNVLFHYQ